MKVTQIDGDDWQEGRGYRKRRLLSADELRQPGALLQLVVVPPGSHIPPHSHATSVEVYVVRRGVCELVVNGQRYEMCPGDTILMEPGDVHELTNRGAEAFELLVFKTNAAPGDTAWEDPDVALLAATSTAYAAIMADPEAKRELEAERALWDNTLMDGLEDEASA
jgi:quercetin dioxygenase-like cupin family protein